MKNILSIAFMMVLGITAHSQTINDTIAEQSKQVLIPKHNKTWDYQKVEETIDMLFRQLIENNSSRATQAEINGNTSIADSLRSNIEYYRSLGPVIKQSLMTGNVSAIGDAILNFTNGNLKVVGYDTLTISIQDTENRIKAIDSLQLKISMDMVLDGREKDKALKKLYQEKQQLENYLE